MCVAELAGGVAVYLCTERAAYLNGREFNVNWDVDEAEAKKEQILERDLLKFKLAGEFGAKYFEKK